MQENGNWTGNKMAALTLLVLVAIYGLFTQHQEHRSGVDEDGQRAKRITRIAEDGETRTRTGRGLKGLISGYEGHNVIFIGP